jgi:hypothetical protein
MTLKGGMKEEYNGRKRKNEIWSYDVLQKRGRK